MKSVVLGDGVFTKLRLSLSMHQCRNHSFLQREVSMHLGSSASTKEEGKPSQSSGSDTRVRGLGSSREIGPRTGWLVIRDPDIGMITVDLMTLRQRRLRFGEPSSQGFSSSMPFVTRDEGGSLKFKPVDGKSRNVAMVSRPVLRGFTPLRKQSEHFSVGLSSDLFQFDAVHWTFGTEVGFLRDISVFVESR